MDERLIGYPVGMPTTADGTKRVDHVELLELEHEGWQALCTGHGTSADFYAAMMVDAAVMVMANGQTMSRDEIIEALRESPPWDTYAIDDPSLVPISDDVSALVYRASGRRGDTEFRGVMTSVYVRTPDGWRLALHQQTALP